jgi:hypothetical protein
MDDTTRRVDDVRGASDERLRDVRERDSEPVGRYGEREGGDMDRDTRQVLREIEETRSEMSETIDAIQDKLKPGNIVANATDRVKSAATERVRDMAETATETAQQAMTYTRESASSMIGGARRNPMPLALIGVGTAWLLAERSRSRPSHSDRGRSYAAGAYGRAYGEIGGPGPLSQSYTGRERDYRDYGDDSRFSTERVGAMARRGRNQLQRMIQDNPLLVGAGALMLGMAFGLAVPETETENELMGETRDRTVGRAVDAARDAASQVGEAASGIVGSMTKGQTGRTQS